MDDVLLIAVIGLTIALAVALVGIRRRTDELDELRRDVARKNQTRAGAEAARTAAAMRESVESLEAVLPVGVLHFGQDRRIERANERAYALLDVKPGRLIGRTVMEAFLDPRAEGMISGVPIGGSATGEVKVGDREPHVLVIRVHRPDAAGVLVVIEDASELRRLQQIRSEFIDNLSHELRTPLSTVSLLAETLARDAESSDVPARMRERITKIEVETGHLVQMVNELLDLARIEGGSQLVLADDVDLGALAEASVERLRLFADRNGVTLVVAPQPGLPAVRGDEARLGQVFVNLVHNAIKFSPDGGEVRVDVRSDGGEAVSAVTDHGIGIPKGDQSRIFERFYKADRARLRGGGTGLGLSIARHIVEGHGGRIWVESEEGRGSTFSFAIPVAPAGTAAPRRPRRARPPIAPASRRRPRGPEPEPPMDRLLIATLNILNLADRWAERLPLLLADMAALQPDLIGLQEVVYPMQQDRLLGAAGEGRYEAVRGWAGRPEYGNSLLVKAPLVATDVDRLDLGRHDPRTASVSRSPAARRSCSR